MSDNKNTCSEWATKEILKDQGIESTISELKECECLEFMLPCAEDAILKANKSENTSCEIKAPILTFELPRILEKHGKAAVRIVIEDSLHTILLTNYDPLTNDFTYTDVRLQGKQKKMTFKELAKLRHKVGQNQVLVCESKIAENELLEIEKTIKENTEITPFDKNTDVAIMAALAAAQLAKEGIKAYEEHKAKEAKEE